MTLKEAFNKVKYPQSEVLQRTAWKTEGYYITCDDVDEGVVLECIKEDKFGKYGVCNNIYLSDIFAEDWVVITL